MFIFNILVYVFFAFFASSIAKRSETYIDDNGLSTIKWDHFLILFIFFFTIIGGIRWNVGSDCLSYAHTFKYGQNPLFENDGKESLWWLIIEGLRNNGLHWSITACVCAFLQIFFITKALQPYRYLLIFLPFVFLGGRYWMDCMGAVRQMIVSCGFLWASQFIYKKEIIKYAIFIIIASMIHQSAILLLPLYFLPSNFYLTNRRWELIGIFFLCFVTGQTPSFKGLAVYVSSIAGATNYEGYATTLSDMLLSGNSEEVLKFGPMMLSYLLIAIFIIWFGEELKETYEKKIPCINLWFNLSYFYACSYFLFCNLGHIFIRPLLYLSLFQMIMATILLYHLWTEYVKYGTRQIATVIFCITIATNTCWDVYKASGLPWEISTYKVFFLHEDQVKKFGL